MRAARSSEKMKNVKKITSFSKNNVLHILPGGSGVEGASGVCISFVTELSLLNSSSIIVISISLADTSEGIKSWVFNKGALVLDRLTENCSLND